MRVFKKMKVLILITPVLAVMFLGCATSGKSGKTDEAGATLTLTRQDTESAIAFLINSDGSMAQAKLDERHDDEITALCEGIWGKIYCRLSPRNLEFIKALEEKYWTREAVASFASFPPDRSVKLKFYKSPYGWNLLNFVWVEYEDIKHEEPAEFKRKEGPEAEENGRE